MVKTKDLERGKWARSIPGGHNSESTTGFGGPPTTQKGEEKLRLTWEHLVVQTDRFYPVKMR